MAMVKNIAVVLAVVLAGSASADGWRDLRIDGSSEEGFAQSMTRFKDELSQAREYVFGEALKDIWNEGARAAEAEQREYAADEFYRKLDGLRYEEVVNYTDPTGRTAKVRYGTAIRRYAPKYPPTNHVIPAGPLGTTGQYPRPDGPGHRG
jgi:hypothetical protein